MRTRITNFSQFVCIVLFSFLFSFQSTNSFSPPGDLKRACETHNNSISHSRPILIFLLWIKHAVFWRYLSHEELQGAYVDLHEKSTHIPSLLHEDACSSSVLLLRKQDNKYLTKANNGARAPLFAFVSDSKRRTGGEASRASFTRSQTSKGLDTYSIDVHPHVPPIRLL